MFQSSLKDEHHGHFFAFPSSIITYHNETVQFSSVVQSSPALCDPMNCSMSGPPSITNSWSSPKLMSIEWVMPYSHLILCHPLLLLAPNRPSIRVFSNESTLHMRWTKEFQEYWSIGVSALASIFPKNTQDWSLELAWLDLFAVQGTLKSLLQQHSSKASTLWCSAFFTV